MQPLHGEDDDVLAMMGATQKDLLVPEPVRAVEEFYRALWNGQAQGVWKRLTTDTRIKLDELATLLDSNGKALLQTREFPNAADGNKAMRVSLAALFLVRRPTSFRAMTVPKEEETAAFVVVKNRRGAERTVELRRERGGWRIHQTDFSKLPPAQDLKPKLLPSDKPMVPTAPEPTPPASEPTNSADEPDDSDKAGEPTEEPEDPEADPAEDVDDDDDDVDEPDVEPTPAEEPARPDTDF